MGFISSLLGRGNPIDSFDLDGGKVIEIQLTKKVEDLHSEVRRIDQEVQSQYALAKTAPSESEKVSYARRIKTLDQKKEMKIASVAQIEKQLRVISNLIILKEREKDLPPDLTKWLKKLSPEQLEKYLIENILKAEEDDGKTDIIIGLTSGAMNKGVEPEEDLSEILDTINAGPEESITPSLEPAKVRKTELE